MSFFLVTNKLIRFWILHSTWVRLNFFISCFIVVCLHGEVIVIIASQIFSLPSQLTFMIQFHLTECFKNFLPFSSIPFTITGAQLNEAGKKKLDSGNCLTMHVTFNVFICNRMIKLKIASKRGELQSNNEELGKYTLAVILKITVC